MRLLRTPRLPSRETRPSLVDEEQKIVLGISIMILLAGNFVFKYLGHTYFSFNLFDIQSPGFWLVITNAGFISAILLLNKKAAGWAWSDIGLAIPPTWWKPILTATGTFIAVLLLSLYVQPILMEFGSSPDITHLLVLRQNLPLLILALMMVWIASAFLEELVFRAFLINSLDIILGRNATSTAAAVIISSVVFGLMHAWQGLGGILFTSCIGLIFGIVYILNGRRIWPVIAVHGVVDTISLITLYNA